MNSIVERRRLALEAIVAGKRTQSDVAREFEVSRQAVNLWLREFKKDGKVVGDRSARRRRTKGFGDEQENALRQIVSKQLPSEFGIESDDDRWHWLELHDLIFDTYRRRMPRKDCMKLLTEWGISDPDISIERKRALRHNHRPLAPAQVSNAEADELQALLKAARERMERESGNSSKPRGPSREQTREQKKRAKAKAKAKAKRRNKRKQNKHKRK